MTTQAIANFLRPANIHHTSLKAWDFNLPPAQSELRYAGIMVNREADAENMFYVAGAGQLFRLDPRTRQV